MNSTTELEVCNDRIARRLASRPSYRPPSQAQLDMRATADWAERTARRAKLLAAGAGRHSGVDPRE